MNQNRDDFSSVRVGAYGICPTNEHIRGRTNQNLGDFSSARVGMYGIRPTNEHIEDRTDQNRGDFSSVRVGAYRIRPTNEHIGGQMNRNRGNFSSVRVGAYCIRPTNGHIGGRMNQNRDDFSSVRVGAYGICPTNEHIGDQTNQKKTGSVVHLFTYDEERAGQYVPLLFSDRTMGAYAIRPYLDERKGGVFFVRCQSGMGRFGGCGLLLFVGKIRIGGVFLVSLSPFLVLTGGKETKESQAPAGGVFFVRRWAGMGRLGGGGLLLSIDSV